MNPRISIALTMFGAMYQDADPETKAKLRKDVDEMFRTGQATTTVYQQDQADGEEPLRNDAGEVVDINDDAAWEKHLHSLVGKELFSDGRTLIGKDFSGDAKQPFDMSKTDEGQRQLQRHQAKTDFENARKDAATGLDVTDEAAWARHLNSFLGKDI